LVKLKASEINLLALEKRIKVQFPEIEQFTFAKALESNFSNKIDTVYTVNIKWKINLDSTQKEKYIHKFEELVKLEIELATRKKIDTVKVYNN